MPSNLPPEQQRALVSAFDNYNPITAIQSVAETAFIAGREYARNQPRTIQSLKRERDTLAEHLRLSSETIRELEAERDAAIERAR